jgi:uncharacterized protein (DUF2147 family)
MKKIKTFLAAVLVITTSHLFAQTGAEKILGKWKAEDDIVVEFLKSNTFITINQVSAIKEKDKKDNGKQVGKDVKLIAADEFSGIVIDPSDKKEYKAKWIIAKDGKTLTLKIKWGFFSHSETWTKQ